MKSIKNKKGLFIEFTADLIAFIFIVIVLVGFGIFFSLARTGMTETLEAQTADFIIEEYVTALLDSTVTYKNTKIPVSYLIALHIDSKDEAELNEITKILRNHIDSFRFQGSKKYTDTCWSIAAGKPKDINKPWLIVGKTVPLAMRLPCEGFDEPVVYTNPATSVIERGRIMRIPGIEPGTFIEVLPLKDFY